MDSLNQDIAIKYKPLEHILQGTQMNHSANVCCIKNASPFLYV